MFCLVAGRTLIFADAVVHGHGSKRGPVKLQCIHECSDSFSFLVHHLGDVALFPLALLVFAGHVRVGPIARSYGEAPPSFRKRGNRLLAPQRPDCKGRAKYAVHFAFSLRFRLRGPMGWSGCFHLAIPDASWTG
eukprot:scaffold900_cov399-Pavlova_lutheri.AAC.7